MGTYRISWGASGWEGVHSTRPLVRLVRMEYHLFHWYSIGELHIIMGTYIGIFMCADQAGSGFILLVHWCDWYDWYE